MDHILARQISAAGVCRLVMPHRAVFSYPGIAFNLYLLPAPADDCAGYPPAMGQVFVRRVHDRINIFLGEVTMHELEALSGR